MLKSHGNYLKENREIKLQDVFLNFCRREKIVVEISTLNGLRQAGRIIGFDSHAIILENKDRQNLIYKNAIVAVHPQTEVNYIFNDNYRSDYLSNNVIEHKVSDRYSKYGANFS